MPDGTVIVNSKVTSANNKLTLAKMDGGYLAGDYVWDMAGSLYGGKDTISITTMNDGYVGGDAGSFMLDNSWGRER